MHKSFDAARDVEQLISVASALVHSNGSVTLLHGVEHLPQYTRDLLPENHFDIAKAAGNDKLTPLKGDKPETKTDIVKGHAGRGILDFAAAHESDCIVIASHRPGLQDYLLGYSE